MPSRMPIIPTSLNNRMLLRALHNEMYEKEILKEIPQAPAESTTSGVHSNSSSAEESDYDISKRVDVKRQPVLTMPQDILNTAETQDGLNGEVNDSGSGSDEDSSLERSYETGQSQSSCSSEDNLKPLPRQGKYGRMNANKCDLKYCRANKSQPFQHRATKIVVAPPKKKGLSEKDKQQIREGYERHVVWGERPPTGASFEARHILPNGAATLQSDSDDEIVFPFERTAAGKAEELDVKQAKAIENAAKQKTKREKQAIAEAKLTVSEAKLTEFAAKLRARQARIDERHAKLCRRRAVIKEAEDRLQDLESRLDDEEECHRERERRVKNRERRVKQEEAGIQIKEVSLKKRETKVTEDLNNIDRRRKILEEKESMSQTMQDMMTKRENLYHQQHEKKGKKHFGTLTKLLRKPATAPIKDATSDTETLRKRDQFTSVSSLSPGSCSSTTNNPYPVPSPRKSLKNLETSNRKIRRNRSNSFESALDVIDVSKSSRKRGNKNADKFTYASSSRQQNNAAIMGLWL